MARRPPTPNARHRAKRDPHAPYPYARKAAEGDIFDPRLRVTAEFVLSAPSLGETPEDAGRKWPSQDAPMRASPACSIALRGNGASRAPAVRREERKP